MDPKKSKDQDIADAKSAEHENSANQNQNAPMPIENPPSYNEAIRQPPFQDVSYSTPMPSAPIDYTSSYSNNTIPPGQYPQPDPRWDDRATRIVVLQRIQMNDQFNNAKTAAERDQLWNIILLDLINYGYYFNIFDLIQLWEIQFHIYRRLLESLMSTGNHATSDWQFFEPMHSTFGNQGTSDVLNSMTAHSVTALPDSSASSVVPPISEVSQSEIQTLPETAKISDVNLDVSSSSNITPPISIPTSTEHAIANGTADISSNEHMPLLTHNGDVNIINASSDILNTSTVSPITETAIKTTSVSGIGAGGADLTSVKDALPPSNILDSVPKTNLGGTDVITSQPDGFSVPKFLDDNVVTTQPTFTPVPTAIPDTHVGATEVNHDDGCCFCCFHCWPCDCDHHDHADHTDHGGCCGDDCCDCDGCCDGGDCCDGCDGCDGCDADCSGC